jgi:hypothetical protein
MILPRPAPASDQARGRGSPYYPMQVLNGLVQRKLDRQAPSSDYDETPVYFRRYVNASGVQDVQIQNMLRNRIATGWRFAYPGAGWFAVPQMLIPGQTHGNYMRGMSPPAWNMRGPTSYTYETVLQTPAGQSQNPGGVGMVNATHFVNPMTG